MATRQARTSSRARRRRVDLIAFLVVPMVLAVACAPIEDEEGAAENPDEAEGPDEEVDGPRAVEDVELDEDAVFRFAYTQGVSRFDPHRATNPFDGTPLMPTYDRLVHRDPEGEAIPGLAEDWEFLDDDTALELSIREGVTFHDGEVLDADAVAANLDRALTLDDSAVANPISEIDEIEVVDNYTVRLTFDGPGGHIPLALTDRAGMMISPEAFDNDDLDLQPVGAGMFEVVDYRPDEVIRYEPYENYWDPDAINVAGYEHHILSDPATRLNALREGDIHLTFLDHHQWEEAEQAGLEVAAAVTFAQYVMPLDRSSPPFDDARVRRAVNYALDREQLVDGVLFGHGEPAVQPFPAHHFAHNPNLEDRFPHDPERARELQVEAGYEDGVSFTLLVPTQTRIVRLAEAMEGQLAEAGFDVELRNIEPITAVDTFYVQGEGDAQVGSNAGEADPAMSIESCCTPGLTNVGDHVVPEIEELHREAMAPPTPEERAEVYHELMELYAEESMMVYAFHDEQPDVWRPEVVGYELPRGPRIPEFRGVGIAAE